MAGTSGFEGLRHGTHLCSIYKNKEEQFFAIMAYIKDGLLKGDKLVGILTDDTKDMLIRALSQLKVDVERCREWGQFIFINDKEFYLDGGRFEPERIMGRVTQSQDEATLEGYKGLRGIAEMDCFLSKAPGTEQLIEYESNVNYLFPQSRLISICHYNENLFDDDTLLGVLYTHPRVILYGKLYDNPYYIRPELFLACAKDKAIPGTYKLLRDALVAGGPLL